MKRPPAPPNDSSDTLVLALIFIIAAIVLHFWGH